MRDAASSLLVPLVGGDWGDAAQAAGALGLVAVLSLATFLWSLPELGAGRGPWAAVLDRTGQDVRADPRRLARHRDPVVRRPLALAIVQSLAAALTTLALAASAQLPEVIPLVDVEPLVPQRPGDLIVNVSTADTRAGLDSLAERIAAEHRRSDS
ncbi:hypothetical protein M3693_04645 [Cellulosimicrobium funkei]|uniref:hypothetical protein n=1 Tax=Cellulosimicrobium funkei TaxID=264251 RepID=UPI00203B61E3|nr:hypothetical protein [Cellulosimicrobium funkei]MCM3533513.1 hypothetical protein [Cellulosimicrobium funkei]